MGTIRVPTGLVQGRGEWCGSFMANKWHTDGISELTQSPMISLFVFRWPAPGNYFLVSSCKWWYRRKCLRLLSGRDNAGDGSCANDWCTKGRVALSHQGAQLHWNPLEMGTSVTILTLRKMCLWDFFFCVCRSSLYYQAQILTPRPPIPTSRRRVVLSAV